MDLSVLGLGWGLICRLGGICEIWGGSWGGRLMREGYLGTYLQVMGRESWGKDPLAVRCTEVQCVSADLE